MSRTYIACDLGAESGRVMLGHLDNGRLELEEVHRFSNGPSRVLGSLRWNVLRIFDELKIGLKKVAERGIKAESLSVDSWGVDYVLLHGDEPMLSLPYQYRDARTDATFNTALKKATPEVIFEETGIEFMSINTLYQLLADVETHPELLNLAGRFLMIGDYFNYLFSGAAKAEESLASTSQVYNPRTRSWSKELVQIFGFPERLFPEVVPSGTVLAPVTAELIEETNLDTATQVIATCTHDTGCAVAAVPAEPGDDWAYLSSGTWSLIGLELPEPLINSDVQRANFTNELGLGGTSRFLKNIVGLWILQECRRAWAGAGIEYDYAQLTKLAEEAEPLRSLINPNDPRFLKPFDMPAKVQCFCEQTGQPVPETPGQFVRCIFESLALLYRQTLDEICAITGRTVRKLHIVGGGSKSRLLNHFAANATGRTVIAGPVEATAIGNVLIQAIALGHLESHAALRDTVRSSFPVETFEPADTGTWDAAYQRFKKLSIS